MILNQLWNEHGREDESTRSLYQHFFDSFMDQGYLFNGNKWQGIRLIARQYTHWRTEFFKLRDPNEIPAWLKSHQVQLFNIPMIHAYNGTQTQRKPIRFLDFEFTRFERIEDTNMIYTHNQAFEEDLKGPGFEGEFRVYIPYNPLQYDMIAVKEALASYGIYTFETGFGNGDAGRWIDGRFMMLSRDWNFEVDWNIWVLDANNFVKDDDDFDEDDELWESMTPAERKRKLGFDRAREIDEGFDPMELDHD